MRKRDQIFWDFFDEFPSIAIILLLCAIYFINGPRFIQYVQLKGVLPLSSSYSGVVESTFLKFSRGKYGFESTSCYANVELEEGLEKVRINCKEKSNLTQGSSLKMVNTDFGLSSFSYVESQWYFHFILLFEFIALIVYSNKQYIRLKK